jgi:hypothetical protein
MVRCITFNPFNSSVKWHRKKYCCSNQPCAPATLFHTYINSINAVSPYYLDTSIKGRDTLTMGYLDNGSPNKYEKKS